MDMSSFTFIKPNDIEKRSFEIIKNELASMGKTLPLEYEDIIMRVIHTTADFSFSDTLCFSQNVCDAFISALKNNAVIITDTNMALSGINKNALKNSGCRALCFISDDSVAKEAKERGVTRATVSMERASSIDAPLIFAIGNAPTALIELYNLISKGFTPKVIIGTPVGFVNVEASKELIMESGIPFIVNRGRKGGSAVAAAICNAFLYRLNL